ncbi:MAG: glutathione transferase GstA [Burkholderiales bacterium]|jgi:glutathione S-transferase|nr:glutathione transferase GstA [Burkholderiales bacterium]
MKLYFASGSCALAVHIALAEAGLKYEAEAVDLRAQPHKTASGAVYTEVSPKGYVPALVLDNGELLTETQVLLQYVADQVPEKALAPKAGEFARYRLLEWLSFIATEIHKGFSPLWNPASTPEQKDAAWAKLASRLAYVNEVLSSREFLIGKFSVADAYLFTCLRWTGFLQKPLTLYPNVLKWMERVIARPGVRQAMQEEGLY